MSEIVKNGKVSISERDKYVQASVASDISALSIPEFLERHFEALNLVGKWVSKKKISDSGGRHPSGWIPYEMSPGQKEQIGGFGVGTLNGPYLERGDMVLAVKPIEAHKAHAKSLRDKTNRQIGAFEELEDAAGKKMLDRGKPGKN